MKKISVIVPMYKVEAFLPKCLDSIINQTYKNLEIILVNDGSPDRCGEIAEEYAKNDNRIKVIHQANRGLCAARNAGLKEAKGDYIAFVDSDDYIDLNMYEDMIKEADEQLDIISCLYYEVIDNMVVKDENIYKSAVLENEQLIWARCTELALDKAFFHLGLTDFRVMVTSGPWDKLYKKSFLDLYNLKFDEELKALEDIWFNYQVLKKAKRIKALNNAYYYYRVNPQSITKSFKANRIELNDCFISRLVKDLGNDYFINPNSALIQSTYEVVFRLLLMSVRQFLCNPENKKGFWEKRKIIAEISEENVIYKQAILAINIGALSKRQKSFLRMLKMHMYSTILLAGTIRNHCHFLEKR
jgi:glycosyltransferase involved in cell wall biosynthesis